MLDSISTGLIAIFNGLVTFIGGLFSLTALLVGLIVVALAWMAATEIEELDRLGTKPGIRRH